MFAKTKKFYSDNEKTILFSAGMMVGTLVNAHFAIKAIDGLQLVHADHLVSEDTGDHFLRVMFKNGQIRDYLWNYTEVKPK